MSAEKFESKNWESITIIKKVFKNAGKLDK